MRTPRAVLAFSLALATFAAPLAARAQAPGKEVAKRLFEEGVDLEKQSQYAAALGKYKEAEQITVTPGLRFHKGYCLEMTGRLVAAEAEYVAAEKLAKDTNKAEVLAAVAVRLDPLRARIPQLLIRLTAPSKDPDIQLDGAPLAAGQAEGKPFRVDPGEHEVRARAPSPTFKNFVKKVQVPEGITFTVDVFFERASTGEPAAVLVPPASSGAAPVTEPPNEPPPKRSYTLPIVTTAGTLVLAGGGVVLFALGGSAQTDGDASCRTKVACDDERTKVRTFDALALGGFIGAAGLAVVSVVLWTSKGGERSASLVTRNTAGSTTFGVAGSF
jgi:hypothetical protein